MFPSKFDKAEHDNLILDEEDSVSSMYFIQEGTVGIGYYMLTQGISSKFYNLFLERGESTCICDYYCCFDKKSEFIYMAK